MSELPLKALGTHFQAWMTPEVLFEGLYEEFGFTLDAAADEQNALCPYFYTEADNGLAKSWSGHVVWFNPPYRECRKWCEKGARERDEHGVVSCGLILASTGSRWFHEVVLAQGFAYLFKGRIRFQAPEGISNRNAPSFDSALVVFEPGDRRGLVGTRCARTGRVLSVFSP